MRFYRFPSKVSGTLFNLCNSSSRAFSPWGQSWARPALVSYKIQRANASSASSSIAKHHNRGASLKTKAMANSERIYILGLGNIGKIFAHSLASLPDAPPITLLLHRQALADEFVKLGKTIDIVSNGISNKAAGFDFEVVESGSKKGSPAPSQAPISNLIVATKTTQTLSAVSSISHRLSPDSAVVFAQNGMGTVDEINTNLFPEPEGRPTYLAAIMSHGIYTTGPFSCVHAGFGTIKIGLVEDGAHHYSMENSRTIAPGTSRRLLDLILSAPVLSATEYSPLELLNIQLEKLAMNAIMNPLTAIFRVKNGLLFVNPSVTALMHILLREASPILIAYLGDGSEETARRFGEENLEHLVLDIAAVTAGNRSSMLQDVESGKQTEIDYIDGWFVKKGEEFGIKCDNHIRLMGMVEQSQVIQMDEVATYFPDVKDVLR